MACVARAMPSASSTTIHGPVWTKPYSGSPGPEHFDIGLAGEAERRRLGHEIKNPGFKNLTAGEHIGQQRLVHPDWLAA